jgi:hypothetical protein
MFKDYGQNVFDVKDYKFNNKTIVALKPIFFNHLNTFIKSTILLQSLLDVLGISLFLTTL